MHMQPEKYIGEYYEVDTVRDGTIYLPSDLLDIPMQVGETYHEDDWECPLAREHWQGVLKTLSPFAEGVQSVTKCDGELHRLSAPGYLDCTDWTPDPQDIDEDEDPEPFCESTGPM
jgi:hypothetical protein